MRIFNFSAGPAVLPTAVLEQVRDELLDWHGTGMGIMEMSHRGKDFSGVIHEAEADLRALMGIPSNYRVLFLQGGATQQFAQIPMNLLDGRSADYVVTGAWSKKAYKEAQHVGNVRLAGSTEGDGFSRLPVAHELKLDPQAAYLHVCTNETIHGVEMFDLPEVPVGVPLVADMSSHILSRPMDVSRYGLIYAGAQKNIGPAGLVLVIVREDLLGKASTITPSVMNYTTMADNGSMLNTPPTFGIYLAGLIFKNLKAQGGLAAVEEANVAKAKRVYDTIDGSGGFYRNPVAVECRSRMNVPFTLSDPALDAAFLAEAAERKLVGLKGHKSVGGMRASIYNAMSLEGVEALVALMQDFAARKA
ncbi:3-phosphoserine/phosphohydroxythreonine transaminase [Zoogloea sp.]|jgi:phosphoserine aminotransferase|uniref:3-phosphoserine/phosphohydroxythreonine transaminase n=1 Tax=Zoogloea sp. TaxID=49181 RepID=UPI002BBAB8E2|nr:3-phosphoserine/phosphohydroxythreonine transaminase [Zoogloea sp.]MBK7848492.1 3-phosphoserine/phosphohydroxythreonine transaminase [Zoogloea sp.]HOY00108.1 3-phosphoserine/phosphohydroxythreonine transaminase [Zoogloea sp.]HPI59493.1 3-phosphoserine/phosphohydroxythreonine transaminase [Zoogloea sp.]